MPTPLVIALPTDETELRDEIETKLSPYGTLSEGPRTYHAQEILLILDYLKDGTAITASVASLIKTVLDLRKEHGKKIKIGRPPVPLEQLDEAALRDKLGLEAGASGDDHTEPTP